MNSLVPVEMIESKILVIRSHKVILDKDIASLYGVSTKNLNKAVSRNLDRFPEDFMFVLKEEEFQNLKFHFGTSSWGGTRKLPRAFTEQGIAMLSGILRSKRAVQVNILIMRTFVKLRQMIESHKEILKKIREIEVRMEKGEKNIYAIFETLRRMIEKPKDESVKKYGFK